MKRTNAPVVAAVPKYVAVATELVRQIRAGDYQRGDLLPSEPELTRQFSVSRHTVRAALRSLYEKGLVQSQRGRGTVVQSTSVAPRYSHACDSIEDVLQYAAATPRRVMSLPSRSFSSCVRSPPSSLNLIDLSFASKESVSR